MRVRVCVLAVVLGLAPAISAQSPSWIDSYREPVDRIIAAATADRAAWNRLAELTDTFGPRIAGSDALNDAIAWCVRTMKSDGLDDVRADPVKVPHWVRGPESLEMIAPRAARIPMLGLGMSIGTPPGGVEAPLLVVDSFADLERRAADARGRIVLFNVPYQGYGQTVAYRMNGAAQAAQHGAVAALVRSIGPDGLRTPHTGMLSYRTGVARIPSAAIASEDAAGLARISARGTGIRLRLSMAARLEPDADSANVIAELHGTEKPDEVVVVACHLDSWDVGTGASDDGGGCIAAWETLRLLKRLNLRPRRTVRAVLFTSEENGATGGLAYRDRYLSTLDKHVMMLESDLGVAAPSGFGISGNDAARAQAAAIASLLKEIGATHVGPGGGGVDIGPTVAAARVPSMSPEVDSSKYFVIHHTEADTIERIDPAELARHVAAMAAMAYVVADMPMRLGEVLGTK